MVVIILECKSCPYGEEHFKRRMYWYEKTVREKGIPNDIYHHLKPEDAPDEFEQFLWCDKVGGKVYWAGRCEDAYTESIVSQNRSKQKRRNKRERDQKHKNHLKFLAENVPYYPSPEIYRSEIYAMGRKYVEDLKPYYKRCYRGNHKGSRYKFYKKYSNRCVRRYKGEIHSKGNQHQKIMDYWWIVD